MHFKAFCKNTTLFHHLQLPRPTNYPKFPSTQAELDTQWNTKNSESAQPRSQTRWDTLYLLLSLRTSYRWVEARRNQHQLWRELVRHRHEDLEEGGHVVRVVVSLSVEGNVQVEAGSRAGTHVVEVGLAQLGPKRSELVPAIDIIAL